MKQQYKYIISGASCYIKLYHNGELFSSYKVWCDEAIDEIEKLEKHGYVRGYSKEEVKRQELKYLTMINNIIE